MNFKDNLPTTQKILNEVCCGYFSVWQKILMLKESIESSENIKKTNTNTVCLGVKCIQEALFLSTITTVNSWFIDESNQIASLSKVILKLKDDTFSSKLENWYSQLPTTVKLNDVDTSFMVQELTEKRKLEFKTKKEDILNKYDFFTSSDVYKRVRELRCKYVAHKDFRNNQLYNVEIFGHQISDSEKCLDLISEFIFTLNQIINKSTYLDDEVRSFESVSKEFWAVYSK